MRLKNNYNILIPPLSKPFEEFNPDEAKKYFDWHMSQLIARRNYLQEYSHINLDYSLSSLIDIWKWFIKNAKVEKNSIINLFALKKELKELSNDIATEVLRENAKRFTLVTEYIIRDIAMYFGEVCVKNNRSLYWGFYTDPKNSFSNMPVLMGFEDRDFDPPFKASFDPVFIVRGAAFDILDGTAEKEALLNMHTKWQRLIHN